MPMETAIPTDMTVMFRQHKGYPLEILIQFNVDLTMTFARKEDDETAWKYKNKR